MLYTCSVILRLRWVCFVCRLVGQQLVLGAGDGMTEKDLAAANEQSLSDKDGYFASYGHHDIHMTMLKVYLMICICCYICYYVLKSVNIKLAFPVCHILECTIIDSIMLNVTLLLDGIHFENSMLDDVALFLRLLCVSFS